LFNGCDLRLDINQSLPSRTNPKIIIASTSENFLFRTTNTAEKANKQNPARIPSGAYSLCFKYCVLEF